MHAPGVGGESKNGDERGQQRQQRRKIERAGEPPQKKEDEQCNDDARES
jgi:hypothetical protein